MSPSIKDAPSHSTAPSRPSRPPPPPRPCRSLSLPVISLPSGLPRWLCPLRSGQDRVSEGKGLGMLGIYPAAQGCACLSAPEMPPWRWRWAGKEYWVPLFHLGSWAQPGWACTSLSLRALRSRFRTPESCLRGMGSKGHSFSVPLVTCQLVTLSVHLTASYWPGQKLCRVLGLWENKCGHLPRFSWV